MYGIDDYMLMTSAMQSFNNSLANATNTYLQARATNKDRDFSREMSDLQWNRNIAAWNMQNEYNSPVATYQRQLEGLQANGLNPNLVYGSSSSVTGSAGSISPYKFEGYHSTAVPQLGKSSVLDDLLHTRLLQTQVAAQEANNRLINARADNEESRSPGIIARSEEQSYRWRYFLDHPDQYQESLSGELALKYWTGLNSQTIAQMNAKKDEILNYDMIVAQFLNETEAPGTGMTYRQYMESCKAFLPGIQYSRFKSEILDIASRMAYRAKQGQLLDLKKEYQRYVNRLAKYGRSLGNDWVTLLLSGIEQMFDNDEGGMFDIPIFRVGSDYQTPQTP